MVTETLINERSRLKQDVSLVSQILSSTLVHARTRQAQVEALKKKVKVIKKYEIS